MSRCQISRRDFLTAGLTAVAVPPGRGQAVARNLAAVENRGGTYAVELGIVHGLMTFRLTGRIDEAVDRAAGRYRVSLVGEGKGIDNRLESVGDLRSKRWVPVHSLLVVHLAGRESRTEVAYDHWRGIIEYRHRSETFFLRRIRTVTDAVEMPHAARVDDLMSATLNYADGFWQADTDGKHRTLVVRRRRRDDEGPDDVDTDPRAELVPFVLHVEGDRKTGRPGALVDLSRFSSWARPEAPARITFGPDRRPEEISSSLILGTAVTIRIQSPGIQKPA